MMSKETEKQENKSTGTGKGGMQMLYGAAIHQSIATGDLQQMKALVLRAEQHLKDHGDVAGALTALKAEIARLENK